MVGVKKQLQKVKKNREGGESGRYKEGERVTE